MLGMHPVRETCNVDAPAPVMCHHLLAERARSSE
jgi:hypothetical protein